MEAVLALLVFVGVVIWFCARDPAGRDRPVVQSPVAQSPVAEPPASVPAAAEPAARPPRATFPVRPSVHSDAAFFDGYIWGRLQERHDERQHGLDAQHDHDIFDGDDGYDDS